MNYLSHEPEELATDTFFCRWVLQPDTETETFWQDWLQTYPHKAREISLARQLVLLAAEDNDADPSEQTIGRMWTNIQQNRQEAAPEVVHPATRQRFFRIQWVAAAVVILCLSIGGYLFYQNRTITHTTAYGESQRLQLPDGSVVILNAHSELRMAANWNRTATREVWLTGEAFFNVSKQRQHGQPVKFLVHTDDLDVEVKGTQFNVNTRKEQTKVVLSEGHVSLQLKGNANQKPLHLKPGDAVAFSKERRQLAVQHLADTSPIHSWTDNRWMLNDATLQEVASLIEENYGLKVKFQTDSLTQLSVNGVIPTDNLKDLLGTLESILDVHIDRKSDRIIITAIP
ncbi:FecR family protein [Larkinella bovis]|uniref:FecR family protein n=1 Tax=Larkinella bovis TaxID=683041 RepID=A0ABW0ICW4_9BACT